MGYEKQFLQYSNGYPPKIADILGINPNQLRKLNAIPLLNREKENKPEATSGLVWLGQDNLEDGLPVIIEDDADETDTVHTAETVLFTKILDLFNKDKVNTVNAFLEKLDEIIRFAEINDVTIKLTALKVKPTALSTFGVGANAFGQRPDFAAGEVTEFLISDFKDLRRVLAEEWQLLKGFKEYSGQLPEKNLIALIKLTLRQIEPDHTLSPYDIRDLDNSDMTLRLRLYQIMKNEFGLLPQQA